jgi:hypothetical protein
LRLLLTLVALLALAACRGGDHPRLVSPVIPTPTEKQVWSILDSALLTRFDMPRGKVVVSVSVLRMTSEDSTAELMDRAREMDGRLMPLLTAPLS